MMTGDLGEARSGDLVADLDAIVDDGLDRRPTSCER